MSYLESVIVSNVDVNARRNVPYTTLHIKCRRRPALVRAFLRFIIIPGFDHIKRILDPFFA